MLYLIQPNASPCFHALLGRFICCIFSSQHQTHDVCRLVKRLWLLVFNHKG